MGNVITEKYDVLVAAERAQHAITQEMETAIREATSRIREEYRERRNDAAQAVRAAETAYDAAKIAEASNNPMVGKKVMLIERVPVSRWSSKFRDEITYGIVEVKTRETILPANIARGPANGVCFVRLLKKDGSVGVKIANLTPSWKLAE